ncbi:MAG: methylenetetrahydrofolate reductase [Bacillota bacterium]|nr:methylenetetrahydrofolate reductase [Bacillota bacterium]
MPTLKEKLARGQFVVTVELDPPRGADPAPVLAQARELAGRVDAVNIADCPMARLKMSPIAVAALVQRELGLETIFHLTCRDRNLLGLQAELLGAWGLGVRNILALTGDEPARGDHPQATGVYDVDSTGLVRIAAGLNAGRSLAGRELPGTGFLIGVVANPGAGDRARELKRLEEKLAAGAHFIQTQPVFEVGVAESFAHAVEPWHVPVLFGFLPLTGAAMAWNLAVRVPGISIPNEVLAHLDADPTCGPSLARRLFADLAPLGAGIHFFPMGHPERVLACLAPQSTVAASPA